MDKEESTFHYPDMYQLSFNMTHRVLARTISISESLSYCFRKLHEICIFYEMCIFDIIIPQMNEKYSSQMKYSNKMFQPYKNILTVGKF
jgi:hypothetical protein